LSEDYFRRSADSSLNWKPTPHRFKPHWQKKFRAKLFFSSANPGAGGNPDRQSWQVSSLGREML
jgi:hypothetical protein